MTPSGYYRVSSDLHASADPLVGRTRGPRSLVQGEGEGEEVTRAFGAVMRQLDRLDVQTKAWIAASGAYVLYVSGTYAYVLYSMFVLCRTSYFITSPLSVVLAALLKGTYYLPHLLACCTIAHELQAVVAAQLLMRIFLYSSC